MTAMVFRLGKNLVVLNINWGEHRRNKIVDEG